MRPSHSTASSLPEQPDYPSCGTITADDGENAPAQHYHHAAARMTADADDTALVAIPLRTTAAHGSDLGHGTRAVLHLPERAADAARRAPRPIRTHPQAHLATPERPQQGPAVGGDGDPSEDAGR